MLLREVYDRVFLWHPTAFIMLHLGATGTMKLCHFYFILFIDFKTQHKKQQLCMSVTQGD